jgi:hypothetical protein
MGTSEAIKVVTTLINPIHVYSGAVQPEEYVSAQVTLINDLGPETYARILLETLHEEISSIIEEIKMEQIEGYKPNVSFVGEA